MMRVMFFMMGVPLMILSFFEASAVLPYAQSFDVYVDGNVLELSEEQVSGLKAQTQELFEDSRTMPAFGVIFDEQFREEIKSGTYISIKFDEVMEVNDLPFDELIFKVEPDFYGVNLMRANKGIVNGRCIYLDFNGKNMQKLHDFVQTLSKSSEVENDNAQDVEENQNTTTQNEQTLSNSSNTQISSTTEKSEK